MKMIEKMEPKIEKMELPQVCAVHDKNERANAVHAHCVRLWSCYMTTGRRTAASVHLSFFGGAPIPAMCPGAGAQDKARDDEAPGLVRLLGQVDIVLAHISLEREAVWMAAGPTDRAAELRHLQMQMQMQSAKRALRVRGAGPSA